MSWLLLWRRKPSRTITGRIRLLLTIVLRATLVTAIMAVDAESPPRNAKIARKFWCSFRGSVNTKVSGLTSP